MYCVVPLAGPDFLHPEFGVRPLIPISGKPLIEAAIGARPWFRSGQLNSADLIFALRQTDVTGAVQAQLKELFACSQSVVLSRMTLGALHTILAGCALIDDLTCPVAVDLADILFDSSLDPLQMFRDNPNLAAIVPCFSSDDPCYSYLQVENGLVLHAKEKQVISSCASAGVYIFRDIAKMLAAAAWSLANYSEVCYRRSAFVCPSINGLIQTGWDVAACQVSNVISMSKHFHALAGQSPTVRN